MAVATLSLADRAAQRLHDIVATVVDTPAAVRVEPTTVGRTTVLAITVAEGQIGQVVGRMGAVKKALDEIARAWSGKDNCLYVIEVVGHRPARSAMGGKD